MQKACDRLKSLISCILQAEERPLSIHAHWKVTAVKCAMFQRKLYPTKNNLFIGRSVNTQSNESIHWQSKPYQIIVLISKWSISFPLSICCPSTDALCIHVVLACIQWEALWRMIRVCTWPYVRLAYVKCIGGTLHVRDAEQRGCDKPVV